MALKLLYEIAGQVESEGELVCVIALQAEQRIDL